MATVFVITAGPKHEIVATNSVGEPVYASPAISDGRIFIRGERNLYCIEIGNILVTAASNVNNLVGR